MKKIIDKVSISISPEGFTFIYTDELASLLQEGESSIVRVSNVEPCRGGWSAAMKDGTTLGPYKLRSEALAEEVKYLEGKMFSD